LLFLYCEGASLYCWSYVFWSHEMSDWIAVYLIWQYVKVAQNQSGVMELGGNMPADIVKRFAVTGEHQKALPGRNITENEDTNQERGDAEKQPSPIPEPNTTSR